MRCTSSSSFLIFFPNRSISGSGFPTRCFVHVAGSGVFRFRSAFTTKPRNVCHLSAGLLHRSFPATIQVSFCSENILSRHVSSGVLPSPLTSEHPIIGVAIIVLWRYTSPFQTPCVVAFMLALSVRLIYIRPTYQSKSFR